LPPASSAAILPFEALRSAESIIVPSSVGKRPATFSVATLRRAGVDRESQAASGFARRADRAGRCATQA
jgi:hypothetical protein